MNMTMHALNTASCAYIPGLWVEMLLGQQGTQKAQEGAEVFLCRRGDGADDGPVEQGR